MPPANSTFDRCCTLCPFPSISLPWVDVHGSRYSLCAIFIPLLFPRSSWRAAPGFSPGYSAAIAVFAGPVYGQGDASAETPWPGRRHPRDVEEKEEEGQPELQAPREAVLAHRVLFASLLNSKIITGCRCMCTQFRNCPSDQPVACTGHGERTRADREGKNGGVPQGSFRQVRICPGGVAEPTGQVIQRRFVYGT